ncbi:hypothetical protein ACLESD_51105 [Pyxidicoccus sp. 3LFB2]
MKGRALLAMVALCLGCSHAPRPVRAQTYVISEDALEVGGSGGRDCHQEHLQCFERCWNTPPPYPHRKGDGWHHAYCTRTCREAYVECVQEQASEEKNRSRRTLEFPDIDEALAWLRAHQTEVALGTIVVVAGVAFIVATGGSGALLLVPLAL